MGVDNLKEFVGMMIIFTTFNIGYWCVSGFNLTTKEKIKYSLRDEAFILAIVIGAYLFCS